MVFIVVLVCVFCCVLSFLSAVEIMKVQRVLPLQEELRIAKKGHERSLDFLKFSQDKTDEHINTISMLRERIEELEENIAKLKEEEIQATQCLDSIISSAVKYIERPR